MNTNRDTQRSKLYKAENRYRKASPAARARIETVPEMQAWIDKLIASAWWKRHYPHVRHIEVRDGRGRRIACAEPVFRLIRLPLWARSKTVILHEVAHVANHASGRADHGWQFAAVFLELVGHCLGADEAKLLKAEFKAGRVRYTAPRAKRPISEAERAVLVERMAVARAAKAAKTQ